MCKLLQLLLGKKKKPQDPIPPPTDNTTDVVVDTSTTTPIDVNPPVVEEPVDNNPPVVEEPIEHETPDHVPIEEPDEPVVDVSQNDPIESDPMPIEPTPADPSPLLNYPVKSVQVPELNLELGMDYVVQSSDINVHTQEVDHEKVGEQYGIHGSTLNEFNDERSFFVGDTMYIPSVDELCFYEYCRFYDELAVAQREYLRMPQTPNKNLLFAARHRASGDIGASYGTKSLVFYSRNPNLIGASQRRSDIIKGHREYRVNWGENLWKCNIFMHDCVYQAGYKPDVMANQHYITAGSLQYSNRYERIKAHEVTPGCIIQLYNGSESNESHNMVLVSFIHRKQLEGNTERWSFKALGAELDRAAVSYRQHFIHMDEFGDYYKVNDELDNTGRQYIRLFRPLYLRDMV